MREIGELSAGDLHGSKLYQQRARAALPIIVRQAKAGQTMQYAELAHELRMPNPRNLDYVLGAIGNSMLDLGQRWGAKVPPIQALVINKKTGMPGKGISWFAPDAAQFKSASRRLRKQIVDAMLSDVFTYRSWDAVLRSLGLKPLAPPSSELPPVAAVLLGAGAGEGNAHMLLKQAIAAHPEWLGLPSRLAPGAIEVPLYSGDRVDVVFQDRQNRIAVEVKAVDAPATEVIRGLFQCVKYLAVIEAEARTSQANTDCATLLALGGALPTEYAALRSILGIEVREGLGTGET